MRFTAIDFETANSNRASICSVGLAVVEGGKIIRRVRQLIRPQPPVFSSFNISIHGITKQDVADAPVFAEYWATLRSNIQGPLVAHNAGFDMSCLCRALDQSKMPYPEIDCYCTLVLSRLAWPHRSSYKLPRVAQSLGITFQHHDAEEDAAACALILLAACRQLNVSTPAELQDTFGIRAGKMSKGRYLACRGPCASRTGGNRKPQWRTSDVRPSEDPEDENHPFYGKVFVFTGALSSMKRQLATQAVVNCGGICRDTLNAETDYLVLGQEGFRGCQAGHKSVKIRQAEEMRGKGASIEIISELDFLSLL